MEFIGFGCFFLVVIDATRTNLALCGFMGTGKTTVGRLASHALGLEFVETDAVVEKLAGKPIPAIFAEDGEPRFRTLEREAVRRVAARDGVVISLGGGVVLDERNVAVLRASAMIVCLEASEEAIFQRTTRDGTAARPLLVKPDPRREIHRLLEARAPYYRAATPHRVDTTALAPAQVVARVVALFQTLPDELGPSSLPPK